MRFRSIDASFRNLDVEPMLELVMVVEDAFTISGKGNVVTGKIACDKVAVGEDIVLLNAEGNVVQETRHDSDFHLKITGIETFNKTHDEVVRDTNCGMLIGGLKEKPWKGYKVMR